MRTNQLTTESVLNPLRFEPIYQYQLWGGRRLMYVELLANASQAPYDEVEV